MSPGPAPDTDTRRYRAWTVAALSLIAVVHLWALVTSRFTITHNDGLGALELARDLDLRHPSTWYNGFYPVGHTLFCRVLMAVDPFTLPALANLVFTLAALAFAAALLRTPGQPVWLGALAAGVAYSFPSFFYYATQPGPDPGCTAFLLGGAWFLWSAARAEEPRLVWRRALTAGALLGLAALWRHHALPFAAGLIPGFAFVGRRNPRLFVAASAGAALVYSLQIFVNLSAGHGPLATHAGFLAHQYMYGVDWPEVGGPGDFHGSLLDVFALSRAHFITSWNKVLSSHLPVLVWFFAAAWKGGGADFPRKSTALLAGVAPYLLLASLGSSDRAILPVVPLLAVVVAGLVFNTPPASPAMRRPLGALFTAALVAWLLASWTMNTGYGQWRRKLAGHYAEMGRTLAAAGAGDARGVMTNDFSLYFPDLPGFRPVFHGGWNKYDTGSRNGILPDPALPWAEYRTRLEAAGVKAVALSGRFRIVQNDLAALFHEDRPLPGIEPAGVFEYFKVYRLTPMNPSPAP